MGITIGDSLAVVATLGGIGLSLWAMLVALSLLFENRSKAAEQAVTASPWKALILGAMIVLTLGILFLGMAGQPLPGVKLLGTIGLLWLLAQAAVGATGIVRVAARRVRKFDPEASEYRSIVRGTGFLVIGGFLPFLGWFAFAPLILCASLGAGFMGMRRSVPIEVPPVVE